jgi:hypothetical protein
MTNEFQASNVVRNDFQGDSLHCALSSAPEVVSGGVSPAQMNFLLRFWT